MVTRPMTAGPHLILIYQPGQAHGWPTGPGQSADLTIGGLVETAVPGVSGKLFRREGEYWTVRPEGSVARLKNTKGLRCLARLDELEEAERFNDPGHAARASAERHFLVNELAQAVGLGGGDRRAASHAERAMLNVTGAIRAAMAKLARANPSLGRHLAATIRTGRYCFYTPDPRAFCTPDPRAPITWDP
jgi:hypothetical protein